MRECESHGGRSAAPVSNPSRSSCCGDPFRTTLARHALFAVAPLVATAPLLAQEPEEPAGPWRLSEALGTPDWFELKGTIRGRFETFDEQFRGGIGGNEHIWVTRTLLEATVRDEFLSFTGELIDARVYDGISDARLNTTSVNTAEVLQAYVAAEFTDAIEPGDSLRVQLGRHTMNVGSRRLIARNRYRNTINAFTGLNAQWESESGTQLRAFYVHPVQRLPGGQAALENNEIRSDEERAGSRFWGAHAAFPGAACGMDAEVYAFVLDEKDTQDFNSRNREINTLGTRWNRKRSPAAFHWEFESVYQFGESPDNGAATLDQDAWFHHAILGYEFDQEGKPRLEALFDYVTGDVDPNDGDNNRFDTLFGARRFEFGPTGILGAFARSNLVSPGLRFVTKITPVWEVMFTHRFHYLASDRDAWTTAGLQDATGGSGDHIGNLTEFRVRYDAVPQSVRVEFGAAFISAGSFVENTAANGGDDTLYGYLQTNFTF